MFVEAICDVLTRDPGFDVVALHLLDDLDTILADTEQGTSHRSVLDGPVLSVSLSAKSVTLLTK